jgi:plastocyanin
MAGAIPVGLALAAEPHTVNTSGTSFVPKTITIAVGDSVTWKNDGGFHSVDFDDGSVNTAPTGADTIATHEFETAGTFNYYCEIHGGPDGVGMSGTVVVQGAEATPTASPTATATPYYAPPGVTGLRVNPKVFRGRVRGSVKARPFGKRLRVRVTRRGVLVGRTSMFSVPGRMHFGVKLARSIRRALHRGRHPRVLVTAAVRRSSAQKSVRLRRRR